LDRRIARMDSGESQGIPWEQVRLSARRRAGISDDATDEDLDLTLKRRIAEVRSGTVE
jgi:hypothetical protein